MLASMPSCRHNECLLTRCVLFLETPGINIDDAPFHSSMVVCPATSWSVRPTTGLWRDHFVITPRLSHITLRASRWFMLPACFLCCIHCCPSPFTSAQPTVRCCCTVSSVRHVHRVLGLTLLLMVIISAPPPMFWLSSLIVVFLTSDQHVRSISRIGKRYYFECALQ